MPNQVFVSYAWPLKKDHDAIKARDKFMRDLEAELGRKTPLAEHGFCFYDYGHIESGEYDYREKLRASLNNCAVGLILRDQHYMDPAKPYCFWEYQQLSKRAAKADVMPNGPKVMLIVNWDTFQANSIPREWRREHQVVNESIIGELDASTKERITNALRRVVSLGLRNVVIRVLNNNREAIDDYQDFLQVLVAFILRQRDAVEEAVNNDQLKFLEVEPYSDGLTWTRSLAAVPAHSRRRSTRARSTLTAWK